MIKTLKLLSTMPPRAIAQRLLKDRIFLFVLRFAIIFGLLYGANFVIIALSIPGGLYNEWVSEHLRYADFLRTALVKASAQTLDFFGYQNLYDNASVRIPGVVTVRVAYVCMGFGLVSFCWAFVAAYPQSLAKKMVYITIGTAAIILLNILRIAGLAMISATDAFEFGVLDHHTVFNIIVYIFLFLLVMRMVNRETNTRNTRLSE